MRQRDDSITVVVVNWNSRDDLADCLRSLAAQEDRDFSVVVVDNGSSDDSVAMMRRDFPDVRVLAERENHGFAEGVNRGIALCDTAWVATLNNDAEAAPDWLGELRRVLRTGGERLGMIQSRIVFKHAHDRTNSTGVLMGPDGSFIDRHFDAPVDPAASVEEVFCVSAGAALYRSSMLDALRLGSGVFDRTFFMYYEDVDLGWRARLGGWTALYAPQATVFHALHGSASRRGRYFVYSHCRRNRVRTMLKNGSLPFILRGVPLTLRHLVDDVREAGPQILPQYVRAVRDGVQQRRAVGALLAVDRREVERRWVSRAP